MDRVEFVIQKLEFFCPCCWAIAGRQVTTGHKYYADCTKLLGVRYVDGIGWQQLKKDISLMYGHCYKCGQWGHIARNCMLRFLSGEKREEYC